MAGSTEENSRYAAFEDFKQRRCQHGETARSFEQDLRRLAARAKIEYDSVILNQFVAGMPPNINYALRLCLTMVTSDLLQTVVHVAEELLAVGNE